MCHTHLHIVLFNCTVKSFHYYETLNSSPPSAAYMRQGTEPALVQIMACRLFGAKPLPELMLTYSQFDPKEQTSVKFESKYIIFHLEKCV